MLDSPTDSSLGQIRWGDSKDGIDEEKQYEVLLEPEDDPQRLSLPRRWLAVAIISISAHFVTFSSSVVRFCHKSPRTRSTLMSLC
jgi:hypothetical protein